MEGKQLQPVISFCIPTNGVLQWVLPVLDSVYSQGVDEAEFEVVVTDNGTDAAFAEEMNRAIRKHRNLIYQRNQSVLFFNQLEALKLGHGVYLKFVNHRAVQEPGSLRRMIEIVKENEEKKPVLYMANGEMKEDRIDCESFDAFVRELGIYASWTSGVGIWKEEFDRIRDCLVIDKISPHSCILFARRNGDLYRIYNDRLSHEITNDHAKKGSYDLFKAFGIEELAITQNLYIDGDISIGTLKKVKKDYSRLLSALYFDFVMRKRPCSYDLSGFDDAMGIYHSKAKIIAGAFWEIPRRAWAKVTKKS